MAHRLLAIIPALLLLIGCTSTVEKTIGGDDNPDGDSIDGDSDNPSPYYFIAIHNEPNNLPNSEERVASQYPSLQEIVAYADGYGIKLTLMLSAQWADYIMADDSRRDEVLAWKANGHELSAHHHSITHGNWDGYTDYTLQEANQTRRLLCYDPEPYYGSLSDYMASLHALDPEINSGCLNDERDKAALPDDIRIDTCSGLANFGEPGTELGDHEGIKGKNEYIGKATVNGFERRWLAHTNISRAQARENAQQAFETLDANMVFGAVTHSITDQVIEFKTYADFLHEKDPDAAKSVTLREIVENGLLPEEAFPVSAMETRPVEAADCSGQPPCGDGECDIVEQRNPEICPEDCD